MPALLHLGNTRHAPVLFLTRTVSLHNTGNITWRSELDRNACYNISLYKKNPQITGDKTICEEMRDEGNGVSYCVWED